MTRRTRPFPYTHRFLRSPLLGASVALLLTACVASNYETNEEQPVVLGQARVQLTRAETCEGLLASIQGSAVAQLAARVDQIRKVGEEGSYGYGQYVDGDIGVDSVGSVTSAVDESGVVNGNSATPEPVFRQAAPGVSGADRNESGPVEPIDAQAEGGEFSGTTVQVVDVDEADIIKTDGDRLYVLHGGTLLAVKAWPADETSIIASAVVEGEPIEMFVHEGRAVVFSRIYKNLTAEVQQNTASDESDYYGGDYTAYTKITVLEVSADSEPGVVRESYVEGNYVSARRHDGLVRAVIQDGFKVPALGNPNVEFRDPFGNPYEQADIDAQLEAWTERMTRAIRSTDLGDWLPREYARQDGDVVAVLPRCGNYYSPDAGLTESGVTSVVALDLDDLAAPLGGATILGRAERVYSNKNVLLVTQTDYRWRFNSNVAPEQTVLHRFDINGTQTGYTASGAVPGRIHNQFSLDERDGIIRVSTTEERRQQWEGDGGGALVSMPGVGRLAPATSVVAEPQNADDLAPDPQQTPPEPEATLPTLIEGRPFVALPAPDNGPVNRVITLETNGSELVQMGSTDTFGATERIYATRFVGDRAYVVTFRRTDPLFVVDLQDNANPQVVGELLIPGFSDYLYPLGADHLFAIGQDADENGRVRGLALQIFDVSDPTAPARTHLHVYEDNGASPANVDHRAISFHNNGEVVAFPYQNYQTGEQSLEVFGVSATEGFTEMGSMNPVQEIELSACLERLGYDPSFLQEVQDNPDWQEEFRYECQYSQRFRRSVFRDDYVYGIGTGGIFVYELDALEGAPLASVMLPARQYYDGDYKGEEPAVSQAAPGGGAEGQSMTVDPVDSFDFPTPSGTDAAMADSSGDNEVDE